MTQQVNLWQPLADEAEAPLSARLLVQTLGVAVLALAVVFGIARQRSQAETARLAELERERGLVRERVVELSQQAAAAAPDRALAQEVEALAREVEGRHALVRAVEDRALGSAVGFSGKLAGLGRRRVDGVWLARIQITHGGSEIALAGHALSPSLVPDWLETLRGEPAFAGSAFETVRIEEKDDPETPFGFALQSSAEPRS